MGRADFVSLDPETREVRTAFSVGRGAHNVFPSPDGRFLYATSRVDSRIAEVDAATLVLAEPLAEAEGVLLVEAARQRTVEAVGIHRHAVAT